MSSMPPLPQLSSGGAPAFQTQARGCGISYEATGHLRLLPCLSGNRLPASCAAEACLRVSEGMLSRHSGPFLRALASGALHDPAAWTAFRDLSIAQVSDEKKRSADTVPLNSGSDANLTSRLRARLFFFSSSVSLVRPSVRFFRSECSASAVGWSGCLSCLCCCELV